MIVEFIGREAELGLLQQALRSPRSELIPIYGRRRVGKSELILKLMEDQRGVYYLGQQSSAALQVREFLAEAARALGMPLLAELRAADWQPALRTVTEQWIRANPGRKLVLALDEFQWIAASSPNLLAELQHCGKPAARSKSDDWYSLDDLYALRPESGADGAASGPTWPA